MADVAQNDSSASSLNGTALNGTALNGSELREPGERGTLTVKDRVAQSLAEFAALRTPGVQQHSAGLGKLTGRELPRAKISIADNRIHATVDIAVLWAYSLPAVGTAVRKNVTAALDSISGFTVDRVDVVIPSVVTPSAIPHTARKVL